MRVPFSYFLMPVFLFSLSVSPNNTLYAPVFWTFIIIHLLLYPASNGYNSYFDKDEKSIGGLKNPPPVNKGLYSLALLFDALAIGLGWLMISFTFAVMLLVYGLVSKAYSHPGIRLKKYPIGGWLVAGVFQGFFTFIMCYVGINRFSLETAWQWPVLIPAALSTLMLWGNYPMTQIYQHGEDGRRGDKTLSLLLGIRGTFYFVGAVFGMVTLAFVAYFNAYFSSRQALAFLIALSPVVLYFSYWFVQAYRDESKADYQHTMRLNFISATCLNAFFLYLTLSTMKFI